MDSKLLQTASIIITLHCIVLLFQYNNVYTVFLICKLLRIIVFVMFISETFRSHYSNWIFKVEMKKTISSKVVFPCVCLLKNVYRSDLNYLRGAAWIATGALQIEGSKRATDLISDVGHRLFFLF